MHSDVVAQDVTMGFAFARYVGNGWRLLNGVSWPLEYVDWWLELEELALPDKAERWRQEAYGEFPPSERVTEKLDSDISKSFLKSFLEGSGEAQKSLARMDGIARTFGEAARTSRLPDPRVSTLNLGAYLAIPGMNTLDKYYSERVQAKSDLANQVADYAIRNGTKPDTTVEILPDPKPATSRKRITEAISPMDLRRKGDRPGKTSKTA